MASPGSPACGSNRVTSPCGRLAGVISTDEIVQAKPWSNPSASSSSYGGNPLACAAALASVGTIVEDGLVDNSARVGAILLDDLKARLAKYPFVGEIRGRGLLIGFVEIFGASYFSPHLRDVYVFSLLIAVLLLRPTGLLGKAVVEKV